jgi:hypothetical protein
MVRSMIKTKEISKKFYAEAVQCAVYIQNRCSYAFLNNRTPQKLWRCHKSNVAHLKVFGSIAHGKISDPKRTKLEDKSKKYVFIGYSEKSKAYKLYDPIEKKLVISRDVELNEETRWDWNNQQEELSTEEVKVRHPVRDGGALSLRSSEEDFNSGSSDEPEAEPRNPRFYDLRDLYETTGEVHLVCLLADVKTISFDKAVRDPK